MWGQIPAERALMDLIGGTFNYAIMSELQSHKDFYSELIQRIMTDPADVIYLHIAKDADEAGHDDRPHDKVKAIEAVDQHLLGPLLEQLNLGDILVVTSDHATPCAVRLHTADPVPVLVYTQGNRYNSGIARFGERTSAKGELGTMFSWDLLPKLLGSLHK